MPFAPSIRKQILKVLSEHVIPFIENECPLQLLLEPPCDFRGVPHKIVSEEPLPDLVHNPLRIMTHWDEADMSAWRISQLAFSYCGTTQERVGLTQKMADMLRQKRLPVPDGVVALQVKAPAAFYVPAGIPHSGRHLYTQEDPFLGILVLYFTERDCFLRHYDTIHGAAHNLNISDSSFKQMEINYADLLRKCAYDAAHRHLLCMMQRLQDYLNNCAVSVANTAWSESNLEVLPGTTLRTASLCHHVMDYIQFHLSDKLNLERLAQVCGVTPQHLSSTFKQATGVPLMTYVTLRRLSAAEMMLAEPGERIHDIAQLVGFSSSHSFAVVFKRHYGLSPSEYRRHSMARR